MLKTTGYAAPAAGAPLKPFELSRRDPGPTDLLIDILFCGICHSDIHQVRNEWGTSSYPMVPGHEIVGRVQRTGARVRRFKKGDTAGVGCFVDSCRACPACRSGEEQFCEQHTVFTYNSVEKDGKTPTYGGYSTQIVVDEKYALKISPTLPPAQVAPLLCAGITTYAPLKRFHVRRGKKVGVIGLGGLGHMAVKLAASMGAEVTVFSHSDGKRDDTFRLGARRFVVTTDLKAMNDLSDHFDFILDTVSASHDVNGLLNLVALDGAYVLVGVPEKPYSVAAFTLIGKRRILTGSLIGGIRETQEMLDYCARKKIIADVETIPIEKVNEAYDRTVRGDVKYRFVIDLASLRS